MTEKATSLARHDCLHCAIQLEIARRCVAGEDPEKAWTAVLAVIADALAEFPVAERRGVLVKIFADVTKLVTARHGPDAFPFKPSDLDWRETRGNA